MTLSLRTNQAFQASSLIGHSVYVPSGHMIFNQNETVDVLFYAERPCVDAMLYLENAFGDIVYQKTLGDLPQGDIHITFDPLDGHEVNLVNGQYLIRTEATVGVSRQLIPSYIKAQVMSVQLAGHNFEPLLILTNNQSVALSMVRIIM